MKHYIEETAEEKKKRKKLTKKDDPTLKSKVTKRDFGLTENAKVVME